MKYFLSEEAKQELLRSEAYYNEQKFGLGFEFIQEVRQGVERVCKEPSIWPEIHKNLQRYYLDRFPFQLIYRIKNQNLEIIAIAHNKKRPRYWLEHK